MPGIGSTFPRPSINRNSFGFRLALPIEINWAIASQSRGDGSKGEAVVDVVGATIFESNLEAFSGVAFGL